MERPSLKINGNILTLISDPQGSVYSIARTSRRLRCFKSSVLRSVSGKKLSTEECLPVRKAPAPAANQPDLKRQSSMY